MKHHIYALGVIASLGVASAAQANLQVQFIEGAPKDKFVLTNVGQCALPAGRLEIGFEDSQAGLIFDVTNAGAGVEVFQPFEITAGAQNLAGLPIVADGDQRVALDILGLERNETVAFTIDVDDTSGTREITVADSEARGTNVSYRTDGSMFLAVMEATPVVTLTFPDCGA